MQQTNEWTNKKFLGTKQSIVEAHLNAKDCLSMNVLSLSGDPTFVSCQTMDKEAVFSSRMPIKALLCDSEGNMHSLNYGVDFSDTFSSDDIFEGMTMEMSPFLTDITFEAKEDQLHVRCIVDTQVHGFLPQSVVESNLQDLSTKSQEIQTCKLLCQKSHTFQMAEEKDINDTVGKMLLAEPRVAISFVSAGDGSVMAKGDVFVNMTYMDGSGALRCDTLALPFTEEMALPEATDGCVCQWSASVPTMKMEMDIAEMSSSTKVAFDIKVCISITCFEKSTTQICTDAFSLENEIKLIVGGKNSTMFGDSFSSLHTVESTIEDIAGNVVGFAGSGVNVVNTVAMGGSAEAECIFVADMLCESEGKVFSKKVEVPFVVTAEGQPMDNAMCSGVATMVRTKRTNDGLTILLDVKMSTTPSSSTNYMVVEGCEVLDKKSQNTTAIEMLIGKKDMTLWDLQKNLNVTQELLMKCNPDLTLPLDSDKKIVVYRQMK